MRNVSNSSRGVLRAVALVRGTLAVVLLVALARVVAAGGPAPTPYWGGSPPDFEPQCLYHGYYPTKWRTWPEGWLVKPCAPMRATEELPTPATRPAPGAPTEPSDEELPAFPDEAPPAPPTDTTPRFPPLPGGPGLDVPPTEPMPPPTEPTTPTEPMPPPAEPMPPGVPETPAEPGVPTEPPATEPGAPTEPVPPDELVPPSELTPELPDDAPGEPVPPADLPGLPTTPEGTTPEGATPEATPPQSRSRPQYRPQPRLIRPSNDMGHNGVRRPRTAAPGATQASGVEPVQNRDGWTRRTSAPRQHAAPQPRAAAQGAPNQPAAAPGLLPQAPEYDAAPPQPIEQPGSAGPMLLGPQASANAPGAQAQLTGYNEPANGAPAIARPTRLPPVGAAAPPAELAPETPAAPTSNKVTFRPNPLRGRR